MIKRTFFVVITVIAIVFSVALISRRPGAKATEASEPEPVVTVKFGTVQRTTLDAYVAGFGSVTPEPAVEGHPPASAKIGSPVSGLLAVSHAVEGQQVTKGAVLFQLDSRVADVQVEKAREAAEFAQVAFDRQKNLLSVDGTSRRLYQEAEQQLRAANYDLANAKTQRALLTITAPISGTIVHVTARPGDAIDLTTALAEIIDLDRLVVTTQIRSRDASSLRRGDKAEISLASKENTADATGEQSSPAAIARISYIGADVDPANDTVTVRASLPAHSRLRPGQFVNVRVLTGERRGVLAVPVEAVITDLGSTAAWVATVKDNVASRQPVKLGLRDGGLVEIQGNGIQEGATIVTTGAYGLPDHTKVRQAAQ